MPHELRGLLSLAWPVILAEVGWVLMGVVDTIMVGPLGPAALGAVGTGSSIFFAFMVFGTGTFFALDTFVSQSYGAGRLDECRRWLTAGLQLAAVLSVVLVLVGLVVVELLPLTGMHPDVMRLLQPYLRALLWSAPALLVYTVLRRYLQAIDAPRLIMVAAIVANLINAAANWVFVYGHLGVPALGAIGSAYATLVARLCLLVMLSLAAASAGRETIGAICARCAPIEWDLIWRLLRLGGPAALQFVLEVGVFAAAAALAGRISPIALAANQVVLNIAGLFFMLPFGLSSAAAVRVGHAVGRGDMAGARRAGWLAIGLAVIIAAANATLFLTVPRPLLGVFTSDPAVISTGVTLLVLCAVFQPFDGWQCVATGALRGIGDTRTPMLMNLGGHWLIGLPVAYLLCFNRGWGVVGLWTGLSLSLILIGSSLVLVWARKSRWPTPARAAGLL
ncbi:MAG: MATE family efflux transporter [Vicinamibacterales bacterium]